MPDGQRADDTVQRSCRSWSVSLPPPVNCCGDGGQVAGGLQQQKPRLAMGRLSNSANRNGAIVTEHRQVMALARDLARSETDVSCLDG